MRRRPVAGMTLAGTLVALLSACAAQPTATVNGIQIETELSATEVRHGDSVLVHVLVTNTASGPRTIPWYECPAIFVVENADGVAVAPEQGACTLVAREKTLEPGERVTVTQVWRGEVRTAAAGVVAVAPPGTYSVVGRLIGTPLVSAPVTLHVRAG